MRRIERKKIRQEEAKERQAKFSERTNTPAKIQEYINNWENYTDFPPVGKKVMYKLADRATKMVNHRKKNTK